MTNARTALALCLLIASWLNVLAVCVYAQPTSSELTKAIDAAHVLKTGGFRVSGSASEVIVVAYQDLRAKDQEKDCKLNAILVAKALMDHFKDIVLVRCDFYNPMDTGSCLSVDVHVGDLKAFAAGSTDENKLLASLAVVTLNGQSHGAATQAYTDVRQVKQGVYLEERQQALANILAIKKRGIDVSFVMRQFMLVEEAVSNNDGHAITDNLNKVNQLLQGLAAEANRLSAERTQSPVKAGALYDRRLRIYMTIQEWKKRNRETAELESRFNVVESYVDRSQYKEEFELMVSQLEKRLGI